MYKHAETRSGNTRKLAASVGAVAISAALLSIGGGIAHADDTDTSDVKPNTTATEGPTVKDGVRASGNGEAAATQGVVRNSVKAVPGTKGTASLPDPMADIGWNCLFTWTDLCA